MCRASFKHYAEHAQSITNTSIDCSWSIAYYLFDFDTGDNGNGNIAPGDGGDEECLCNCVGWFSMTMAEKSARLKFGYSQQKRCICVIEQRHSIDRDMLDRNIVILFIVPGA